MRGEQCNFSHSGPGRSVPKPAGKPQKPPTGKPPWKGGGGWGRKREREPMAAPAGGAAAMAPVPPFWGRNLTF